MTAIQTVIARASTNVYPLHEEEPVSEEENLVSMSLKVKMKRETFVFL